MTTDSAERAVVTIWFVSAPNAHAVLASNPQPDTEYGLQLVAGLFPTRPVTPLGIFPLTRSAPAGHTEVYVGVYPGVTVLQTAAIPLTSMLDLVPEWIQPDAADNIYAFAQGPSGAFAGFAHWHHGKLERAFTATTCEILEDKGLPLKVETPYWSGECPPPSSTQLDSTCAIPLPFLPGDILLTLYTTWLGFEPRAHDLTILVNGFAIDGRPEARPVERISSGDALTANSPEIGEGTSPDELIAAELEEATGAVTDDIDGSVDTNSENATSVDAHIDANSLGDTHHKESCWTRFKRWCTGKSTTTHASADSDGNASDSNDGSILHEESTEGTKED